MTVQYLTVKHFTLKKQTVNNPSFKKLESPRHSGQKSYRGAQNEAVEAAVGQPGPSRMPQGLRRPPQGHIFEDF